MHESKRCIDVSAYTCNHYTHTTSIATSQKQQLMSVTKVARSLDDFAESQGWSSSPFVNAGLEFRPLHSNIVLVCNFLSFKNNKHFI